MVSYFKMFGLVTVLYALYSINYIAIREAALPLYLGDFFDYKLNVNNLLLGYFLSVPFVAFILKSSINKIFPMLLSTLVLIGSLPSVIIYSLSNNESINVFILFYIYVIFIFSFFSRHKLSFGYNVVSKSDTFSANYNSENTNFEILKIIGIIGILFYVYLAIKYFNILSFKDINEVYSQRNLFKSIVSGWEIYFMMFSKSIAAFSLLIVAINLRKAYYIFPIIFIYLTDYSLAAHKSSIMSMVFVVSYYFILSKIDIKRYYFIIITSVIVFITLLIQYAILFKSSWLRIVVSLYDRAFHVTAGLFSRIYEYTNENYFFYGGTGLLGKIFSGVDNGMASTIEIGEAYFSENVQANTNLIADGYLNFGVIGSFLQLFILWLIFNKRDDKVFEANFVLLLPIIVIYSRMLFSTGLQIALLSGMMILFILLIKFVFKT